MRPGQPLRLLVTGSHGQVGQALVALARQQGLPVAGLSRQDLDVTDRESVERAVAMEAAADASLVVINAAAYTAVDRAEAEPALAFAVNRDGPSHLAQACVRHGAGLVHISTDYVFDGEKGAPYEERDAVNPLGVYGQSKWEGEEAVREHLDAHAVLRTAWVFSATGTNFVRTMVRLALERDRLRVVADQTGHPTAATHVAEAAILLAGHLAAGRAVGTVHAAGSPPATWHGLAQAVVESLPGREKVRVEPIATSDYPTEARRPREVVLEMSRARGLGIPEHDWREAVEAVCQTLVTA